MLPLSAPAPGWAAAGKYNAWFCGYEIVVASDRSCTSTSGRSPRPRTGRCRQRHLLDERLQRLVLASKTTVAAARCRTGRSVRVSARSARSGNRPRLRGVEDRARVPSSNETGEIEDSAGTHATARHRVALPAQPLVPWPPGGWVRRARRFATAARGVPPATAGRRAQLRCGCCGAACVAATVDHSKRRAPESLAIIRCPSWISPGTFFLTRELQHDFCRSCRPAARPAAPPSPGQLSTYCGCSAAAWSRFGTVGGAVRRVGAALPPRARQSSSVMAEQATTMADDDALAKSFPSTFSSDGAHARRLL